MGAYPAHRRIQVAKSAMTHLNVLFCTQPESTPKMQIRNLRRRKIKIRPGSRCLICSLGERQSQPNAKGKSLRSAEMNFCLAIKQKRRRNGNVRLIGGAIFQAPPQEGTIPPSIPPMAPPTALFGDTPPIPHAYTLPFGSLGIEQFSPARPQ